MKKKQSAFDESVKPEMFKEVLILSRIHGRDWWASGDKDCKFFIGQIVCYIIDDENYRKIGKVKLIQKRIAGEQFRHVEWLIHTDIEGLSNWIHENHFIPAP